MAERTHTYDCQRCGASVTRRLARGQVPKWCANCRMKAAPSRLKSAWCIRCGRPCRPDNRHCSPGCARSKSTLPVLHPTAGPCSTLPAHHPARRPAQPTTSGRTWIAGICPQCSAPWIDGRQASRFCSPLCSKRWHRRLWKEATHRRIPAATRRFVYARDQAICQLCNEPVDMTLGPRHSEGPTLDHIIPQSLADEPDHSAENLRLAHRLCNSLRGARAA